MYLSLQISILGIILFNLVLSVKLSHKKNDLTKYNIDTAIIIIFISIVDSFGQNPLLNDFASDTTNPI